MQKKAKPTASTVLDWSLLAQRARESFGIRRFRPGQKDLIEAVLKGQDALGILPTGAGKSLTYQLPALILDKSVLVVSPLLSLVRRAWQRHHYVVQFRQHDSQTVRPNVRELPVGKRGIGFARIEAAQWADAWVESMAIEKAANQDNNQPRSGRQGVNKWREKQSPASTRGTEFGTSTKSSEVSDFKKALDQARGKKRSST